MYSVTNNLDTALADAEKFAMDNDRMLYAPFFRVAEEFAVGNGMVLGGKVGLDLLVGEPLGRDSFMWEFYTDNAFMKAKALTDALAAVRSPHVPTKYTCLRTDVKHREFTILVNTRQLFKIYSLERYRGIELMQIMGPAVRTSYFTQSQIKCVSEEMQLIECYRTLYTPAKCTQWEAALGAEIHLQKLLTSDDTLLTKAVRVGAGRQDNAASGQSATYADVVAAFMHYISDPRVTTSPADRPVIIGDWAMTAMGDAPVGQRKRLQIITSSPIDDVLSSVTRVITSGVVSHRRSVKLTSQKFQINLFSDFQLTKHTVYMDSGRDQSSIADVFNSTAYEMIPVYACHTGDRLTRVGGGQATGGVLINGDRQATGGGLGTNGSRAGGGKRDKFASDISRNICYVARPWVVLRFKLIDLWLLKIIVGLSRRDSGRQVDGQRGQADGQRGSDPLLARMGQIVREVGWVHEYAHKTLASAPTDVFPLSRDDYAGVYTNEAVAKKKLIMAAGFRLPLYYPYKATRDADNKNTANDNANSNGVETDEK